MIESVLRIVFVALYVYPAWLIVKKWFADFTIWEKIVLWLVGNLTFVPLLIFYFNYFVGIPFNYKNVSAIIVLLNIILILLPGKKPKAHSLTIIEKVEALIFVAVLMTTVVSLTVPYWAYGQPIIGGDSPHYLYNSSLLIKNEQSPIVFDRSSVYYFPAIVSLVTGLTVESALKLFVVGSEALFIGVAMLLAKRFVSARFTFLLGITLIGSAAVFNLSKFVIAYFLACALLYASLYFFTGQKSAKRWLLSAVLVGLIFNVHGVIAFASLAIFTPLFIRDIISKRHPMHVLIGGVFLLIAVAQPLIFSQGSRLIEGVIAPLQKTLNLNVVPPITANQPEWQRRETVYWVSEYVSQQKPSGKHFPLYQESFESTYSVPLLILALGGLTLLFTPAYQKALGRYELVWLGISLFLLTQQEFIGTNWFAIRFVFALAPIMYLYAFLLIEKVFHLSKAREISWYLLIGMVVLPTVFSGLTKMKNLQSNISKSEYQFIHNAPLSQYQNMPIFVAAPATLWLQALHPSLTVFQTHFDAICADEQAKTRMSPEMWEIGWAFSEKVSLEESMAIFRKYSQGKPYLVYLDTKNYRCINGDLFPAESYPLVESNGDGLFFLRYN